jgi:hypothetical protein
LIAETLDPRLAERKGWRLKQGCQEMLSREIMEKFELYGLNLPTCEV